jgi:hypothetical protein
LFKLAHSVAWVPVGVVLFAFSKSSLHVLLNLSFASRSLETLGFLLLRFTSLSPLSLSFSNLNCELSLVLYLGHALPTLPIFCFSSLACLNLLLFATAFILKPGQAFDVHEFSGLVLLPLQLLTTTLVFVAAPLFFLTCCLL